MSLQYERLTVFVESAAYLRGYDPDIESFTQQFVLRGYYYFGVIDGTKGQSSKDQLCILNVEEAPPGYKYKTITQTSELGDIHAIVHGKILIESDLSEATGSLLLNPQEYERFKHQVDRACFSSDNILEVLLAITDKVNPPISEVWKGLRHIIGYVISIDSMSPEEYSQKFIEPESESSFLRRFFKFFKVWA